MSELNNRIGLDGWEDCNVRFLGISEQGRENSCGAGL